MHISPTHFPTFRTGALAAVLSAVALVSSAAQQLVVPEGSRVRLTWMSIDQGTPDWLVGEVTQTTSGNRLELLPEGRTQPTTVLMSESTRLQIYRGRRSNFRLGAGIGGAAGALVGGLFFSEGFGGRSSVGGSFEWTQSALAFGAAGATVLSLRTFAAKSGGKTNRSRTAVFPFLPSHPPIGRDPSRCDLLSCGNGSTSPKTIFPRSSGGTPIACIP